MKELHKRSPNPKYNKKYRVNIFFLTTLISENQIRLQFALHPSSSQSTIAIGIWYAPWVLV